MKPLKRIEHFLAKIAGDDSEKELSQKTRYEHYLNEIAENISSGGSGGGGGGGIKIKITYTDPADVPQNVIAKAEEIIQPSHGEEIDYYLVDNSVNEVQNAFDSGSAIWITFDATTYTNVSSYLIGDDIYYLALYNDGTDYPLVQIDGSAWVFFKGGIL